MLFTSVRNDGVPLQQAVRLMCWHIRLCRLLCASSDVLGAHSKFIDIERGLGCVPLLHTLTGSQSSSHMSSTYVVSTWAFSLLPTSIFISPVELVIIAHPVSRWYTNIIYSVLYSVVVCMTGKECTDNALITYIDFESTQNEWWGATITAK